MADDSSQFSDGSDIEADYDDIDDNLIGQNVRLDEINEDENVNDPWVRFFDDNFEEDLDNDEFLGFDRDWVNENFAPRVSNRYTNVGGATQQHPEEARPIHYFDLLWGRNLWDMIVTETNRYAQQQRERNPPPPFAPRWKPVDILTMKAFLGLTFVMGILRLPARNDYWRSSKRMFQTAFSKVMPRDRFNLIWRYLHLQNNEAPPQPQPDKLRKIRPLIEYLNIAYRTAYTPHDNVTVDESMVKFKGRLGFRQYLPAKPIKWGLKLWTLADSVTGYLCQFQVYTGKDENNQGKGLSHRVVMDLVSRLQFTNVRVYFDNFYTSANLLNDLFNCGIYGCGTVRSNRKGLPTELLPKNVGRLQKHEYKLAQKDNLTYLIWQDTKPVLFLSNFHDPEAVGHVNRRSGNPEQARVHVPKVVEDYQANMKGVDLLDQMVGYYMPNHRSRKWWRRLFHHLQLTTAYNAYVLAKDCNPEIVQREWPQFQDFLEDLAEDLIGDYAPQREAPQAVLVNMPDRPAARHNISAGLYEKKKSCKDCRVNAAPGERVTATRQGCVTCRVPVCVKCIGRHIQRNLG